MTDLRALAEAATPGPWVLGSWGGRCHLDHAHGGAECVYEPVLYDDATHIATPKPYESVIGSDYDGVVISTADAAYIAACSPDRILALLDVVDAARAVMHEWTVLGPTGTEDTVTAHARLRGALDRLP